jgi:succinate dehydrogenase (ubiquinone) flavoprotein subunit
LDNVCLSGIPNEKKTGERLFIPNETNPIISQDAGEETVEELDKLRHADGNVTVADLRLEMQKVSRSE